jgi:hypothetical protein
MPASLGAARLAASALDDVAASLSPDASGVSVAFSLVEASLHADRTQPAANTCTHKHRATSRIEHLAIDNQHSQPNAASYGSVRRAAPAFQLCLGVPSAT